MGIVWSSMILNGIRWYFLVFHDIPSSSMVLVGTQWYCRVLDINAWYCILLYGIQ